MLTDSHKNKGVIALESLLTCLAILDICLKIYLLRGKVFEDIWFKADLAVVLVILVMLALLCITPNSESAEELFSMLLLTLRCVFQLLRMTINALR